MSWQEGGGGKKPEFTVQRRAGKLLCVLLTCRVIRGVYIVRHSTSTRPGLETTNHHPAQAPLDL